MNDLHFAVVVGIDRYPSLTNADDLTCARSDAERFHEWLVSPSGGAVPKKNTVLLQDPTRLTTRRAAYPTQRDINDALDQWKAAIGASVSPQSPAWRRSRIYIYLAGHGYAPPDGVAALLLADAADNQLGYHIEIKRYVDWLVSCALFREVLVFSDCCRRQYDNAAVASPPPFATCNGAGGVEVFAMVGYATRIGEDALEPNEPVDADDARGVFTAAILDGLTGGAASESGEVTSASLAGYVRSSVETRTKGAPAPQKVEFPGDLSQELVVCRAPSAPRRSVTLHFPGSASGVAEIKTSPRFQVVENHVLDGGAWTVGLPDGYYELAPAAGGSGFQTVLFKVVGDDVDVTVS
ncbi:MAG TPA: caspase family protein [Solirubrobacteraceae bacterium]|nr:caspase family protein [Solirubrobacteraceae bacterium]